MMGSGDFGGARKRARSCDRAWLTKNKLLRRDRHAQPDESRHVTDGSECWCDPSVFDGVVIHHRRKVKR